MNAPVQKESAVVPGKRWLAVAVDFFITLLLWTYFTIGFVLFFAPFYVLRGLFSKNRQQGFQRLNHYFYRGFFGLCRLLVPRHTWQIDPRIASIQSSVIVCNHISYIDPILLISLIPNHTTIVKSRLFRFPVFGWFLNLSGYLPAASRGRLADLMHRRMENLPAYLAAGGNLIVFPEGTRSRDGSIGPLNKGAFKIARLCKAPLAVMVIRNSERLFKPGQFRFDTCRTNTISVRLAACLTPDYDSDRFSISSLTAEVRDLLCE